MLSHQANTNKPRALKYRHLCFSFDLHNYCPTCREAGKGDDPCISHEKQCQLCPLFTEEQNCKIKNRRRYALKHKLDSSRDDLDLLGDPDMEKVFSGSHEGLEHAAQQLYSSPPHPQHWKYYALKRLKIRPYSGHSPPTQN